MKVKIPHKVRLDTMTSPHCGWWFDRLLELHFEVSSKPSINGKIFIQYYIGEEPWESAVIEPSVLLTKVNGEHRFIKKTDNSVTEKEFYTNLASLEQLINTECYGGQHDNGE